MGVKRTTEDIKEQIKDIYGDEYTLLSPYTRMIDPIKVRHNTCGHEYVVMRAKNFINENRGKCPKCRIVPEHSPKAITEKEFLKRFKDTLKDEYEYLGGFKGMKKKFKIRHNICKYEYEVVPTMLLGNKASRCPKCANKYRGKKADDDYLENMIKNEPYSWLEKYHGDNKYKHKIRHNECGHEYTVRPNDFQQGYRCPKCSGFSSEEENELYEFISETLKGKYKIYRNYRRFKKEIDVYIPKLKLGFEYNGCYWHSDKYKDKSYHKEKLDLFKEKGIDVYFINSVDWLNKKEIIQSKIKSILNAIDEKIYARKTKVTFNIDKSIEKDFLNSNHIQGFTPSKLNIGLEYNDEIVALMTFSDNRRAVNNDGKRLELVRYCTPLNTSVPGGFSKLLKHASSYIKKNHPEYTSIYSFADADISRGNVYEKCNFVLNHYSKPSYFYVYRNKKYNRYNFRKSELKRRFPKYFNESLTELENADNVPYLYRIWNCGNYCYRYDIV